MPLVSSLWAQPARVATTRTIVYESIAMGAVYTGEFTVAGLALVV